MPHQKDKFYQFADLSEYSLRERLLIRLAGIVFFAFIKMIGITTRFEVRGVEHLDTIEASGKQPILCFWHDRILLSTYFFRNRGILVMSSQSFDAEYTARSIQRFGYGVIKGSSTRGGSRALIEMIRAMRDGFPAGFSIDGPRGPRYEAKPGPVTLAKKTGNPILPFVIEPQSFWTVKSWDKMQIPKPFTKAIVIISEPVYVDDSADDAEVGSKLGELQRSLDDLTEQGRKWSGRTDQVDAPSSTDVSDERNPAAKST
ncbi:MAG: lysophospholipid acyltransferase family protein [Acidobacteriota bacterium]